MRSGTRQGAGRCRVHRPALAFDHPQTDGVRTDSEPQGNLRMANAGVQEVVEGGHDFTPNISSTIACRRATFAAACSGLHG